jgi:hypothetical protein
MIVPLGPKPSPRFADAARLGYRFAEAMQRRDEEATKPPDKEAKRFMGDCRVIMDRITADMHYTLMNHSLKDGTDYLRGFLHGIKCREIFMTQSEPKGATTAWHVYRTLMLHESEVNALRSVPQVHEWLVSKLGERLVGNLTRTKMLCQRIGLRFYQRTAPL